MNQPVYSNGKNKRSISRITVPKVVNSTTFVCRATNLIGHSVVPVNVIVQGEKGRFGETRNYSMKTCRILGSGKPVSNITAKLVNCTILINWEPPATSNNEITVTTL